MIFFWYSFTDSDCQGGGVAVRRRARESEGDGQGASDLPLLLPTPPLLKKSLDLRKGVGWVRTVSGPLLGARFRTCRWSDPCSSFGL